MKRTVYTLSVATTLMLASLYPMVGADNALASTLNNLQQQKDQINQQKSSVTSDINESNQEISNIQTEKAALNNEMKRIDLAIGDTNLKLVEKSKEIEAKKGEIQQLQTEIGEITERINKRNELLKDRARSFQENGGHVSYIDVLMGAQSFGDFIDRVGALATILEADQDLLRQHKEDKQLLEAKQKQVEADLASLEKMHQELEVINQQLASQRAEKDKVIASLEVQEEQIHAEKLALEEQAQILASQGAAIQKAIQLEEQRLKEEAAAAAAPAPARNNNGSSSSGGGGASSGGAPTSGGNGGGGSTPAVSGGFWTRPAAGTITSGLGIRWGEYHAGIDIANRVSVPIVAAADGVVSRSYYSNSYGNCIFVSHYNNGQVYTTVYAHMNSRSVGEGAVVKKGQTIGYMGNTGYSTGQHLHFELHVGEWNASKSNAVNPLNYIPM